MSDLAPDRSVHDLLDALELVLRTEHAALIKLDRAGISLAAEQKVELDEALRAQFLQAQPSATLRERVERLKHAARVNQILLVHARSCVQGMLQMLTGRHESPLPRSGTSPPPPVALNVRG